MANNTFSIGHDVSVDLYDSVNGKIISFPAVTGFSAEPITKGINSEPLNGPPLYAENPNGWRGTIDFDRTDKRIDEYFATREALYYQGGSLFSASITQTIRESDGSVTQYRYPGCALKYEQAGQWKAADKVSLRVSWNASQRVKVV